MKESSCESSGAARRIWNMRKSMWIILSVLFVAMGFSQLAQAAPQADRFKALGPDRSHGRDDSLFSPLHFQPPAPSHPHPNCLPLFPPSPPPPLPSPSL